MTDYEKGLQKLGLYFPMKSADDPSTEAHSIDDVRHHPAFAWRVLEALNAASETDGKAMDALDYNVISHLQLGKYDSIAEALYAAVEALGRDK